MSQGMNVVVLSGQLGRDVEVRYIQNGTAVTTLRVAVGERVKRNGEWKDETTWLDVVAWGKTAEACHQYLKKGSGLTVHGRIQVRKYQDKDGKDRYATEVVANQIIFHFNGGSGERKGSGATKGDADTNPASSGGFADDEGLPF